MNILVTGATGFIGSRFVELASTHLKEDDNLILLTSRKIAGFKCILHNNYTFTVEDFYKEGVEQIDKVIHIGHFLAENHKNVSASLGNLSAINNTVHLLNNLPNVPQVFVYCSSMDVYGTHRVELLDEESALCPDTSYAVSKVMTEMVLQEWAKKKDVLLHILRLAHIYGPGDSRKYTIPIWLQTEKKKPIRLFANPEMYRNCLFLDDCCNAMWKALDLYQNLEIINVVSKYNAKMIEIAELCREVSENEQEVEISYDSSKEKRQCGIRFKNNELCARYLAEEQFDLASGLKREFAYFENKNKS